MGEEPLYERMKSTPRYSKPLFASPPLKNGKDLFAKVEMDAEMDGKKSDRGMIGWPSGVCRPNFAS